jgi:hypothetical protein
MEGFAGANIDQLISIAVKVVVNQEEMAKREKEKYLEGRQRSWLWPLKREMGRPEARRETPTGETRETPGKKPVCLRKEEGYWKNECPNKKKRKKKE